MQKRRRKKQRPGWVRRLQKMGAFLLLGAALACYLLFWVDQQIRPVLLSIVEYECSRYAMNAFSDAADTTVQEYSGSYRDLYQVEYNADGSIASVMADPYAVNLLQSRLSALLTERLAVLERNPILVPVGTLLGIQVLAGRGPRLDLQVQPESYVETQVYDTIESAGINQTKLNLYVRYTMNMSVVLSGYATSVSVSNDQFLGQILLVGTAPQVYYSGAAPQPAAQEQAPGAG